MTSSTRRPPPLFLRDLCLNAGSSNSSKNTGLISKVAGAIIAAFGAAIVPEAVIASGECTLPGRAQNRDFTVPCPASILDDRDNGNLYEVFNDKSADILAGYTITVILDEFTIAPRGTTHVWERNDGPQNKGRILRRLF